MKFYIKKDWLESIKGILLDQLAAREFLQYRLKPEVEQWFEDNYLHFGVKTEPTDHTNDMTEYVTDLDLIKKPSTSLVFYIEIEDVDKAMIFKLTFT